MKLYIEGLVGVLEKLNLVEVRALSALIASSDTIWIVGNGGSMSTAAHFAEDLIKFCNKRAIAISESSLISMSANDYGVDNMFLYPLKKMTKSVDLVIGITTSGRSKNVLNVLKKLECRRFLITGLGGKKVKVRKFVIPCNDVQICEDVCLTIIHLICKFWRQ